MTSVSNTLVDPATMNAWQNSYDPSWIDQIEQLEGGLKLKGVLLAIVCSPLFFAQYVWKWATSPSFEKLAGRVVQLTKQQASNLNTQMETLSKRVAFVVGKEKDEDEVHNLIHVARHLIVEKASLEDKDVAISVFNDLFRQYMKPVETLVPPPPPPYDKSFIGVRGADGLFVFPPPPPPYDESFIGVRGADGLFVFPPSPPPYDESFYRAALRAHYIV